MGKFYIQKWTEVDKSGLEKSIRAVVRLEDITKGTRVFIKPNFTFPFFKKGVTTPPDLIRGLVEILVNRGAVVTIGEAGASLDVFNLHDSFADHGLYELQKEYGIKVVHLREVETAYLIWGEANWLRKFPFLNYYWKI